MMLWQNAMSSPEYAKGMYALLCALTIIKWLAIIGGLILFTLFVL